MMSDQLSDQDLVTVPVYWVWIILGAVAVLLVALLFFRGQTKAPEGPVVSGTEGVAPVSRRSTLVLPESQVGGENIAGTATTSRAGAPVRSGRSSLVLPSSLDN